MPTVVGVKLRFTQKPLWFDPADLTPAEGDTVIVQTERGKEVGTVVEAPHEVEEADLPAPLKPLLRAATEADLAQLADFAEQEREALPIFREMVKERQLDMKPIDVECMLDGDKLVFYFAAEERVDFRELVKALASRFKSRVDMRQVGVRDEARMIGGLGHCGQQLCCSRFGGEFMPVSIRMAKEQDLPLNPLKISGLCGRLMCCLRYEFEAYRDYKQRAPKKGAIIETPLGKAQVAELNTPHEAVVLRLEDGKRFTVALGDMDCCKGGECPCSVSREVIEQAGGTGIALALSALDRENEPEPELVVAPPKPRKRRGGGKDTARDTGKTAEQGEAAGGSRAKSAPADAAEAPETAGAPPARKRRRRGGRGGGGGSGEQTPKPTAEQSAGSKPAAERQAPAADAGGEGGATRAGRKRRRRRPGSGGGAGSESAPAE